MPIKGILILVMLATIIGTLPVWPHTKHLGFTVSGVMSICLLAFITLLLCGVF